jgi:cytochrome bd ubiquinol oxidase subunit I
MNPDPLVLARIQFAANISFHILFPSITIALGWILFFFKMRYQTTGKDYWMEAYFFWTKIFALCFAIGVVSGITMSFQFGTNWPGFMQKVGNVAGPLLAYEVLTAFFLEATFLGIMLFGFKRVKPWVHNLATLMVAGGTTLSAFWIIALNSWMQTPAGFTMIDGKAHVTNWLEVIFNPSMPYRFTHMLLASVLTAAFLVAGVSAYRWLRHDKGASVMAAMRTGILLAAIIIPLQIMLGDLHGLNTREHQPQKIAAMEGLWTTQRGAPLVLFALPNTEMRRNDRSVEIPNLASLVLTHDWQGEVKGLDQFENNHPPVPQVFWAFRVMVGTGIAMLVIAWISAFQMLKHAAIQRWTAIALAGMSFSGWVATLAGWYVTEIGRQPWLVTGILKTQDAVSSVPTPMLGASLAMYLIVYAVLLAAFIHTLFYMARQGAHARALQPAQPKD